MKNNTKIIVGLICALLLSLAFNVYFCNKKDNIKIEEKVVTTVKIDTIKDTIPTIKYTKKLNVIHDTLRLVDSVDNNTAVVEIPMSQNIYSDDSTYTAYVSGYKSRLDSINVYRKIITNNKTITITKQDKKKFSVGPVIYGGYDFSQKKFGYGVGVGISYRIFGF